MQRATSDDVDDDEDDEGDGGDEDGASGASSSHGTKKWRIHISGLIRLRATHKFWDKTGQPQTFQRPMFISAYDAQSTVLI